MRGRHSYGDATLTRVVILRRNAKTRCTISVNMLTGDGASTRVVILSRSGQEETYYS